jgi:hypothetical protein
MRATLRRPSDRLVKVSRIGIKTLAIDLHATGVGLRASVVVPETDADGLLCRHATRKRCYVLGRGNYATAHALRGFIKAWPGRSLIKPLVLRGWRPCGGACRPCCPRWPLTTDRVAPCSGALEGDLYGLPPCKLAHIAAISLDPLTARMSCCTLVLSQTRT